jgi:hypothetical protein
VDLHRVSVPGTIAVQHGRFQFICRATVNGRSSACMQWMQCHRLPCPGANKVDELCMASTAVPAGSCAGAPLLQHMLAYGFSAQLLDIH